MAMPLCDVRIVELGDVIVGPLAAALLSDFGAEVIKVEAPDRGDMLRDLGPKGRDGIGVCWKTLARNKRILTLDWKTNAGREVLAKLIENADVLVENFRSSVLDRAGIGPEVLNEWNADLVILRATGRMGRNRGFQTLEPIH